MAVAGRVAPVPKGDYDKNVAYKRLDCVKYLNVLYMAKKDVPSGTAITDTNYWMKGIEGSGGGGSAVIDDTQSSTLTTYSSNKVDGLVSDIKQSVETTNNNVNNIQEAVSDINNSLDNKINSDGNVSETVVNTLDNIPEERILPTVGDKIKVMFAKTVKYFQDLKTIAFTGDYEDLINKPTIPTLVNNYLTTEAGQAALDAYMGKLIDERLTTAENEISTLNSDCLRKKKLYSLQDGDDLNDFASTKLWLRIPSKTSVKNSPNSGITVFNLETGWGILQIAIAYHKPIIYARIAFGFSNPTWSAWYQFTTSII